MDGQNINYNDLSEDAIQALCYMDFHNKRPELRGLLCYNLNNPKNKKHGNDCKAMGLQKGRSDMTMYWNAQAHFLECKTPTGTQSKEQKEWQKLVESQGFKYYIFRNLTEFWEIINHTTTPN